MPIAAPILLVGGMFALLALLGGKKAKSLPAPSKCTAADRAFVMDVLTAAHKGTATVEMLLKAIDIASHCNMGTEGTMLSSELTSLRAKQKKILKTGKVKLTDIRAKTKDYICAVIPGKGYACRPRNPEWKGLAKTFQNVLNIAASRLPGPLETPKLIKVDGRIGPKTELLFEKVVARAGIPSFAAYSTTVIKPESISASVEFLTEKLQEHNAKTGPRGSKAVAGHYGMTHKPPIPGVSPRDWIDFVLCMRGRGSPKGLGMFRMNSTALKKLKVKANQGSSEAQYITFARYILGLAKGIAASNFLRDCIGQEMEGEEITLSGLLALCKQAGLKGAKSWLQNEQDREDFPNTTEAFLACNGIF